MIYSLDTNVLIDILRGNEAVKRNLVEANKAGRISIPPYVSYEVLRGAMDRGASRQLADFRLLQKAAYKPKIDENEVMEIAADIYLKRRKTGQPVGDDIDNLMAAWCVMAGATLVTSNTKRFAEVDGLLLENWRIS